MEPQEKAIVQAFLDNDCWQTPAALLRVLDTVPERKGRPRKDGVVYHKMSAIVCARLRKKFGDELITSITLNGSCIYHFNQKLWFKIERATNGFL